MIDKIRILSFMRSISVKIKVLNTFIDTQRTTMTKKSFTTLNLAEPIMILELRTVVFWSYAAVNEDYPWIVCKY